MASVAILNSIRDNASNEYQLRIPLATQANILTIGQAFSTYTLLYNDFCNALVNKIGKTILETKLFANKLASFKQGEILSAQDVEEIFVAMAKSEGAYDPNGLNPFGRRAPSNINVIYHRLNRQDQYAISLGDIDFRRSFMSESILDAFITVQINSVYSGASYDEWVAMKNVIATYGHTNTYALTADVALTAGKTYYTLDTLVYTPVLAPKVADILTYYEDTSTTYGYYVQEVTEVTDETTARAFLKTLRKTIQDVSFATTTYNLAGVKTWSEAGDLILLINKDLVATIDVDVLAKTFNLGKTDIQVPIFIMDDFGTMTDTYGLLVDKNFLRVYDTLSHMEPQRNAQGLFTNYFYHIHQILSASTFKTAVRFKKVVPVTPAE